jgi:serine/threonine-protein kinase
LFLTSKLEASPLSRQRYPVICMANVTADRNLLFGILALQAGLIRQDALICAMNAWTLTKSRPLGDILLEQGAFDRETQALVEALVKKRLALHEGDVERSLAALSSIDTTREQLAQLSDPDLNASLPHVSTLHETEDPNATQGLAVGSSTSSGLRFRIVRHHARGGLGQVSVAIDQELHREVALKEIQDQYADFPDHRSRFLREAEITGGLEHPGIVPVYGLGQYADGRPFYAMRFIKGDNLKGAIDRFHRTAFNDPGQRRLELRKLLGRFLDVCNAVAYAHSRGVVHRDLKPSNIMLGPYGETLVVDWGLAKPIHQSESKVAVGEAPLRPASGSDAAPTRMGQKVGTLAFMSPEQARGEWDRVGPASDVYSLGATLYYLLTGQAPFSEQTPDVTSQVERGEFPPPRQVNRMVPPALEAICMKAMAPEPTDRYGTPRALADDIEHWLADEPVSARREPRLEGARRWMRRHRALVASGVAALVFAVASLGIITAILSLSNKALAEANEAELTAKAEAIEKQNEARRNFRFARQTVEEYGTKVSANLRLRQADLRDLRRDLLQLAMQFHTQFKHQIGDDVEIQTDKAEALYQLGRLASQIGTLPEAINYYEESAKTWEHLARVAPSDPQFERMQGRCLSKSADLYRKKGEIPKAKESYQQAVQMQQALVQAHPDSADYQSDLAESLHGLGNFYWENSQPGPGESLFKQAIGAWQKLIAEHSGNDNYKSEFSRTWYELAYLYHRNKRLEESEQAYDHALKIQEQLVNDHPKDDRYQGILADIYDSMGPLYRDRGKGTLVEEALLKGLHIRGALAEAHPNVSNYKEALAGSYTNLGNWADRVGDQVKAREFREKALPIMRQLADADPSSLRAKTFLGLALLNLADSLVNTREAAAALERCQEARAILETVLAKDPKQRTARYFMSGTCQVSAVAFSLLGRHKEAFEVWELGLKYIDPQGRENHQMIFALLKARTGQHASAVQEAGKLLQTSGDPLMLSNGFAVYALAATAVSKDAGIPEPKRQELAKLYADRAMETLRQAVAKGYKDIANLKSDPDLASLRSRDDFKKLLAEMEQKAK